MFNTFEQMKWAVANKLAVEKVDGHFSTFKYHRNVHFDKLWNSKPNGVDLMEIRGQVYDNRNGNLIQVPPRKTFNYLENGTWEKVSLDEPVVLFKKYNGFMAAATMYEGNLVVSTTGTTNSDFAVLARNEIETFQSTLKSDEWYHQITEDATSLYEIIHESDPHIIAEPKSGAIPLGWRYKDSGKFVQCVDEFTTVMTLGSALKFVDTVDHEGFMVYDTQGNCCKLKSPYYIGKKKLMRANAEAVLGMYRSPETAKRNLHNMWGLVVDTIVNVYSLDFWQSLPEQTRRQVIEAILNE